MNNHAIGVFDSGVGGITVVKEIMRQLPHETIYYFGDTLRCPYGERSKDEVKQFTLEVIDFLLKFPLKAIVIACNTATAAALNDVRKHVSIPVLGVIEPGARAAIKSTTNGEVGIIGTVRTIDSGAYERTLRRIHPDITTHSLACPTLVPLVESGLHHSSEADEIVAKALTLLRGLRMDTLILGCTHYPLLASSIQKVIGDKVKLISSAEETASELSTILQYGSMLATRHQKHRFFTTGDTSKFASLAGAWLGLDIEPEQVSLSYAAKAD
ncbi:glutamate racemase [Shimazuella sp. AN120528]|uniref:glutamate racemase n=1 Tax=Shimazuella soli TaxID=1892854 RepID=UPI001F0D8BD1|nr:glutamate racemase [Shimazuella soli]MCH5584630.1 glutamate racemase [Shimazuella soli]